MWSQSMDRQDTDICKKHYVAEALKLIRSELDIHDGERR